MTAKERYRQLCDTAGDRIPVLLQYWWWDAVCGDKQWDVLLSLRNGTVVAALPYLDRRRLGIRYSPLPQLTMYSGPWLSNQDDTAALNDIYRQLKALHLAIYIGRTPPGHHDADTPARHGFDVSTRHTYRFDPIRPLPDLMAQASQLRRRDIQRLGNQLTVVTNITPTVFADLHTAHYSKSANGDLLDHSLIARTCSAAINHGHGTIVGARRSDGSLCAALFVVYDSHSAYLLMMARTDDAPRNVTAFLIWRTIDIMYRHTQIFDFEGGMEPGVEEYYRSFGAHPTTMLQVSRCTLPFAKRLLHL